MTGLRPTSIGVLALIPCLGFGQISWEQRAPIGSAFIKTLGREIVVGGKVFLTSNDSAETWQSCPGIQSMSVADVAEADGTMVAVGDSGRVAVSKDGRNWTRKESGTKEQFKGIAFGAGHFVAVGYEGTVAVSPDGDAWEVIPKPDTANFYDIAFGGGMFAVSGSHGMVMSSPDARTWTASRERFSDQTLKSIAWGNQGFLAVGLRGNYRYSKDGVKWGYGSMALNEDLNSVAFGDSNYLAGGSLGGVSTYNGSWTRHWGPTLCDIYAVGYSAGRYLIRDCDGLNSFIRPGYTQRLYRGSNRTLRAVTHIPEGFLAVGQQSLLLSKDGWNWEQQDHFDDNDDFDLHGIAVSPVLARAVGGHAVGLQSRTRAWTSDGKNWSLDVEYTGPALKAVAWGGKWVELTQESHLGNPGGESMTIGGLVYADGRYVTVGHVEGEPMPGTAAVSTDGTTWEMIQGISRFKLNAVAYGAGTYLAVGDSGTVCTSTDGKSWTLQPSAIGLNLVALAFGEGKFLATARGIFFQDGGAFLASVNGVIWTAVSSMEAIGVESLAFGDGLFMGVGTQGRVFAVKVDATALSTRKRFAASGDIRVRRMGSNLSITRPGEMSPGPVPADLYSPTGRFLRRLEIPSPVTP